MSYKTLLTFLSSSTTARGTLEAAASLAERLDAHLDLCCVGLDRTEMGYYHIGAPAVIYQETLERAQNDAAKLDAFARERLAGRPLRWTVEPAVTQLGGLSSLVAVRARFSDLVVMPKPYAEGMGPEVEAAVEAALFAGQAPVLVVPETGIGTDVGRTIVIAWNQSAEALVAVRRALPLLQAADLVNILVVGPPRYGPERSDPGGALCQMLARHGVRTEVSVVAPTMPRVSDMICRHVRDRGADMVVMGAYGHSRFREAILGGATRHMLELAEMPVFMAH